MNIHTFPWRFRLEDRVVGAWRRHPGLMGLALGLLVALPWMTGFAGTIVIFLDPTRHWVGFLCALLLMLGGGWATMTAHESLAKPIATQRQREMIARLGPKVVASDRRLCELEARLIARTQEAHSRAAAHSKALQRALPSAAQSPAHPKGRF